MPAPYRGNIIGVRDAIKEWLPSVCHVEAYDVDYPTGAMNSSTKPNVKSSHVVFYPFQNTEYRLEGNTLYASADVGFTLKYVYPYSNSFDSLNIKKLELLSEVINAKGLIDLASTSPIIRISTNAVEFPVQVERTEEENNWGIQVNIEWRVEYIVSDLDLDNEFGPIDDGTLDFNSLTIKVFKDEIPVDTVGAILDMEYTVNKPEEN